MKTFLSTLIAGASVLFVVTDVAVSILAEFQSAMTGSGHKIPLIDAQPLKVRIGKNLLKYDLIGRMLRSR